MERGFLGPSGHSMVNALLFYYQIEHQKAWTQITRPKSEETRSINYGRMPGDFWAVDNLTQLLLLLCYGQDCAWGRLLLWMRHFILRA
jgi:hypothetical protein